MLGEVFASLLRRAIFLCHLILFFHWIDGIGHTFYRATSLGCRGNTALEGEYHEELGFIYGTKFCVLALLQFSILLMNESMVITNTKNIFYCALSRSLSVPRFCLILFLSSWGC